MTRLLECMPEIIVDFMHMRHLAYNQRIFGQVKPGLIRDSPESAV